jgi:hypothetical protein
VSGVGGSKEKIGRLQELLERVQMRATVRGEDRVPAAETQSLEAHASEEAYQQPAAQTSPPPATYNERHDEMSEAPPTPAMASAPPLADEGYDVDTDSDVEVSSEVVEVDIDIDEPMPLESGAQPVAQQTMPPDELLEEVDEQPMATEASVRPAAHEPRHEESREEEIAHAAPPANEIEEPTPSSSRRPIAGEEASVEEAYAAESSPRHTPPPESGKQVAASPSAHPPSWKPSAPPPSLEGHTLIGGWREPGLRPPSSRAPAPLPRRPPARASPPTSHARSSRLRPRSHRSRARPRSQSRRPSASCSTSRSASNLGLEPFDGRAAQPRALLACEDACRLHDGVEQRLAR